MNRRSFSLVAAGLALAAFVAAAVPAFGDDNVAPRLDRRASAGALARAQRALGLSRQARRVARRARAAAANAGFRAEEARAHANAATALGEENRSQLTAAQGGVKATNARIDALEAQVKALAAEDGNGGKVVSATESGLVSTSSPTGEYEALGGPSVQVTVPPSGLIEVWAQVAINDDEGGGVGLFEDGQEVDGVAEPDYCGDDSALIDASSGGTSGFVLYATPPVPGVIGCTSAGAPASVLLDRSPGPHTYELRYAQCSCGGAPAEFRDRTLRVAPRP